MAQMPLINDTHMQMALVHGWYCNPEGDMIAMLGYVTKIEITHEACAEWMESLLFIFYNNMDQQAWKSEISSKNYSYISYFNWELLWVLQE